MRINNDKYYTPENVALYCAGTALSLIGKENISHIIEPSAGGGVFLKFADGIPLEAYDIEPEHPDVIEQDFLTLDIPYKKNRMILGNPPFGKRMVLAQKFFKKSIQIADYVAFILPVSQHHNTNSLYEFDMVSSDYLGNVNFSGKVLKCVFNVYKRPESGVLNSKPKNKLQTVTICRNDSKKYTDFDFDIRLCAWGNATGKVLNDNETYAAEYKIKIEPLFREQVVSLLSGLDWKQELNCIAMPKLQQFHIINMLKKYIKNIY